MEKKFKFSTFFVKNTKSVENLGSIGAKGSIGRARDGQQAEVLALKLLKLGFVEGGIEAIFGHELFVVALLGNSLVLDD